MARHIMAVCVVCLLCADRIPCQQHFDSIFPTEIGNGQQQQQHQRTDVSQKHLITSIVQEQQFNKYDPSDSQRNVPRQRHRSKRHAGHAHETLYHRPEITEDFLQRIFEEYGQGDGTIQIQEFQRMLRHLGLHQLVEQKWSNARNNTCIADTRLVQHIQPHDHSHTELLTSQNCSQNANGTAGTPCLKHDDDQSLEKNDDKLNRHNYTLSTEDMINLCPVLLYQLASPVEAKRSGCINGSVLADIDSYEATKYKAEKDNFVYVWIYAFISVFACSILGLVGVAIIPFMETVYYQHIIQFLVSLAVGTMTGDALLHLLPHSLAGQSEQNMIFKGLTCMGGIVLFYMTEHGLTMISEWRKRVAKGEPKKLSVAKVVRDPNTSINNTTTGDKVCKSKYSSYPYCYDEIAMDTKNDLHLPPLPPAGAKSKMKLHSYSANNIADALDSISINNLERKRNGKTEIDASEAAVAQALLPLWNAPAADLYNNHHHNHNDHQKQIHLPDSNTISTDLDVNSMGDGVAIGGANAAGGMGTQLAANGNTSSVGAKEKSADTITVILREHESSHHGHSHKHGHVHSPPETLSAVAWMIIMGDGLHNFTDGMAIGAAFSENIAGGFSTSLAVFCHELPHELGDFAILIKAGMSVKSAVYYNLLTGVLSFIGMIFGIIFGQSPETAQWMFAAAAGLFIYIALVDMMPELSSSHKSLQQFVLQILGMSSGVLIMLTIAIYEGDLMNVFSSSSWSSPSPLAAGHKH